MSNSSIYSRAKAIPADSVTGNPGGVPEQAMWQRWERGLDRALSVRNVCDMKDEHATWNKAGREGKVVCPGQGGPNVGHAVRSAASGLWECVIAGCPGDTRVPSARPEYRHTATTASEPWAHGPGDTRADTRCLG